VSSITVTPTLADPNASVQVRVNGGTYATLTSGSASAALALDAGINTVDLQVTAQDGVTTKTYTVTILDVGTISFTAAKVVVNHGSTVVELQLIRSDGTAPTSVVLNTTDGSAKAGIDFTGVSNRIISFGAGVTTATTSIELSGVAITASKLFTATIAPNSGAVLGDYATTTVRIKLDTIAPIVAITKPVAASTVAVPATGGVAFEGTLGKVTGTTAAGDSTIDSVSISINGGAPIAATISTDKKKWTVSTTTGLVPQSNSVTVTAIDLDGNTTTSAPRSFTYKVLRTLAITSTDGSYTISPTLTAGKGIVGQSYTITAKANTAFFFSSFSGGGSPATVITPGVTPNMGSFTFAEGNTVTINFVATPFTAAVAGLYNGIVQGSTPSTY